MKVFYEKVTSWLNSLSSITLLLIRLVLAYGLWNPALVKLKSIPSVITWFESLGIPFPTFSAYAATIVEAFGVVFLTLGLFTRLISAPLMATMIVAISFVHWNNGFYAAKNGFEIPLYYFLLLLVLLVFGPGKISIDERIKRKILE